MKFIWDTNAVIPYTKSKESFRTIWGAWIRSGFAISGVTLTELAAGEPRSTEEENALDALLRKNEFTILPEHRDFLQAGLWLRGVKVPGTAKERKDRRLRLTMDALIAATAAHREMSVVTENTKDFLRASTVDLKPRTGTRLLTATEALESLGLIRS